MIIKTQMWYPIHGAQLVPVIPSMNLTIITGGIYINSDAFYGDDVGAVNELLHELMHLPGTNESWTGAGHDHM